jgi:membrane associated rhomboid family serine protease
MVPGEFGILPLVLVTSTLANPNLLMVVLHNKCAVNSICLYYMGRYFERSWGSKELLKHFIVVTVSTNVLTLVIVTIHYMITENASEWFSSISGMGGFLCALVIAFKRVQND